MFKEFKAFILRGNVMDLAVGVIIGGAFGAITNSLVNDVLMPTLGILTGGVNFSGLKYQLTADPKGPAIAYGNFIQSIISFLILAFAIFLMVKAINKMVKKKEEAPAGPTKDQELLTEIRDLLKKQ
jgi:large conductance mechanosensitive channel